MCEHAFDNRHKNLYGWRILKNTDFMKVQIITEKKNPLMKRNEVVLSVDYEGGVTPSKQTLQQKVSEEFNSPLENIEIRKILSETGYSKGKAWINVWEHKVPEKKMKKKKGGKGGEGKEKGKEQK